MSAENCGNCRFINVGQMATTCRRRAPVAISWEEGHGALGVSPPTTEDGWCGEWEGKAYKREKPLTDTPCPANSTGFHTWGPHDRTGHERCIRCYVPRERVA